MLGRLEGTIVEGKETCWREKSETLSPKDVEACLAVCTSGLAASCYGSCPVKKRFSMTCREGMYGNLAGWSPPPLGAREALGQRAGMCSAVLLQAMPSQVSPMEKPKFRPPLSFMSCLGLD